MDEAVTTFKGFACQCGEIARAEMDALRALAVERKQVDADPKWFTTRAIHALDQGYRLELSWLATDQWGGMGWKTGDKDEDPFTVVIEWDVFEDGLAMALDACFQKWGKWRVFDETDEEEEQ